MSKVYFLLAREAGLLKIGRSSQPVRRIAEIRDISPIDLDLIGVAVGGSHLEAHLHSIFASLRVRGEWFKATPELVAFAQMHCLFDLWHDLPRELREKALEYFKDSLDADTADKP